MGSDDGPTPFPPKTQCDPILSTPSPLEESSGRTDADRRIRRPSEHPEEAVEGIHEVDFLNTSAQ